MKLKYSIVFITVFLLFSCVQEEENVSCFGDAIGNGNGKLLFSFDDRTIFNWHSKRALFNKYKISATFFISDYHTVTGTEDVERLRDLVFDGHEIGYHGLYHTDAVDYVSKYGIESYVDYELEPGIEMMYKDGFYPKSFAFPYSRANKQLFELLLTKFDFVRSGTTLRNAQFDGCDGYLRSASIDGLQMEDLDAVKASMEKALAESEYLLLFAHQIRDSSFCTPGSLCIDAEVLEALFKYSQSIGIEAVPFSKVSPLK